jgi:hypothetical protein
MIVIAHEKDRCPHCDYVLRQQTRVGWEPSSRDQDLGYRVRTCPSCSQQYKTGSPEWEDREFIEKARYLAGALVSSVIYALAYCWFMFSGGTQILEELGWIRKIPFGTEMVVVLTTTALGAVLLFSFYLDEVRLSVHRISESGETDSSPNLPLLGFRSTALLISVSVGIGAFWGALVGFCAKILANLVGWDSLSNNVFAVLGIGVAVALAVKVIAGSRGQG